MIFVSPIPFGTKYTIFFLNLKRDIMCLLKNIATDVIKVLVNAMHSSRSPYRWDFNIMDIPITYNLFQNTFKSQCSYRPECIALTKTSITFITKIYHKGIQMII